MPFARSTAFALLVAVTLALGMPASSSGQPSRELTVAFTVDVQTLDPRMVFTTQGGSLLSHIYETLVITDADGALKPRLAERWTVVNPTTIRFHLRKGVKFHNGEPFDGDAVKYSIETRGKDSKTPQRSFFAAVDRVDVVDPHTVDLKLNAPATRVVLRNLAYYYGMIVPPKFAQQSGDRFATAVGTGPYRLVEYRPGERLVVERHPGYWGKPGATERIVFRVIAEPGTRVASLERGEVDVAYNLPIDQVARLRGSTAIRIASRPTVRMVYLGFRVDRKPLDDPRVRQALAMLVNASEINTQLLGGLGRIADGFVAPEVFGHAKPSGRPAFDVARARALLTEAGAANTTLRLGISNGRFLNDRQIGETISAYFEQAGLRVELDAPEFGAFFREISQPGSKYDAYVISWGTNTLDADFTMSALFHEKFSTYNMYRNKDVSSLIDQARAAVSEKDATTLYQRIQETLMRDLPWAPVALVPDVVGVQRGVDGLQLRADELIFFWDVGKK
jgi:ABC-type transport system substrate-binding protein